MSRVNMYAEHAKDLLKPPPGWDAYHFECIGGIEVKLIEVTGAVAPLKTKGKSQGLRNWKKMDASTKRTAYFTPQEHDAWLKSWEQKTGNCSACGGDGKELESWSKTEGTKYRDCKKCSGSGKSKLAPSAEQVFLPALTQQAPAQESLW